jgi:AraC-like DNA-binding protein
LHNIGLMALDLGVRGAAAGLFLMIVIVLLRIRPVNAIIVLSMALAAAGAAYAIVTAPFFPKQWMGWSLPIMVGNPVIFWLWARAAFEDEFIIRRWHGVLWLVIVGIGFCVFYGWTAWPILARAGGRTLSLVALVLALAAAVQTIRTWPADLVAGRRRLRVAVLIMTLLYIGLAAGSDLASIPLASLGVPGSLASALGLYTLAMLGGFSLFSAPKTGPAVVGMPAEAAGNAGGVAQTEFRADDGRESIAPMLLRRLDNLMSLERIYRQEGLTIGTLAAKLDLPEYRLRQVINEGLGYRNFNAFLNRYRIDEAKAALSEACQKQVPVLTIAMDCGFQSIGPFNRAFKADTGLTPTEFRRDALARSRSNPSETDNGFEIGQPD